MFLTMLLINICEIFSNKTLSKLSSIIQSIKVSANQFETALSTEKRINSRYVAQLDFIEEFHHKEAKKLIGDFRVENRIFSLFDKVLNLLSDVNDDQNIEKVKQLFDKEIHKISSLIVLLEKYYTAITRLIDLQNNTHDAYNLNRAMIKELKKYLEIEKKRFEGKKSIKTKVNSEINIYKWILITICTLIPCIVLVRVILKNRKRQKDDLIGKV